MNRPAGKIAFVSPHCAVDFTNGAATATLDALVFLQSLGFQCEVFCNSRLDSPDEVVVEKMLAERGLPCMARNAKIGAYRGRMIFTVYTSVNKDIPASGLASVQNRLKPELQQDGPIFADALTPGPSPGESGENGAVPVTIFNSVSTRGAWKDREEVAAFLTGCEIFLRKNRPDVVWTYGGDPVSLAVQQLAKRLGMGVLFFLHNFSYRGLESFRAVDWIAVPSQFSRDYYRRSLGLECEVLPYVIDAGRVLVATRATSPLPDPLPGGEGDICRHPNPLPAGQGTFVTFVNPLPAKGLYVFARIAEVLSRRRPDIRLLVIEGRSGRGWRQATGIDLTRLRNVTARPAMPDPRAFYAVTRVLLMPSLWNESFGLAAAEAMMNGIPVLASNRGALPETIGGRPHPDPLPRGEGGSLFDIPARYTPDSSEVPTGEEVEPWVETIIRLWDNPTENDRWRLAAQQRAQAWHPDCLAPIYRDFFSRIASRASATTPRDGAVGW